MLFHQKIRFLYYSYYYYLIQKYNKFLYTPKNEIKGNFFDLDDESNNPMPLTCEYYDESMSNILSDDIFDLI